MAAGDPKTQQLLVIECHTWFSEVRQSLSEELGKEFQKATVTSAPPAENYGAAWNSPKTTECISFSTALAKTTEPASPEGAPFSENSGSGNPTSAQPPKNSANQAAMNFFGMRF